MKRLKQKHKWIKRFLDLAEHIAGWGKDPVINVGAVIVGKGKKIVGIGYAGFASGVSDDPKRYSNKNIKRELVVHAEVNAVLNARASVEGCVVFSTLVPCPRCASVLAQSKVKAVYCQIVRRGDKYVERNRLTELIFREAKIPLYYCEDVDL